MRFSMLTVIAAFLAAGATADFITRPCNGAADCTNGNVQCGDICFKTDNNPEFAGQCQCNANGDTCFSVTDPNCVGNNNFRRAFRA